MEELFVTRKNRRTMGHGIQRLTYVFSVRGGVLSFFSVVSAGVSSRTRSTNAELFPVSLALPKRAGFLVQWTETRPIQVTERIFLLPSVGKLLPVPVFRRNFGPAALRPKDHSAGLCHYGRRLELAGRRYGNRLANGRLLTYDTLSVRIHDYLRS